jgi:3-hydroxyisobutyrate dehydrogenase-like beta-hydroxyacid dehydrogenase
VIHVGPLGAGEVAKLANNAIMNTTRNVAIEVAEFARAYGVTEEKLLEVCATSSAESWVLDNWAYFDDHLREGRGADAPQVRESVEAASDRGVDLPICKAVAANAAQTFDRRAATIGSAS